MKAALFVSPGAPRRRGRPTILNEELVEEICAAIRLYGMSDSEAGLMLGVSSSTVSRWKQDNEDFAIDLGQARAQFNCARLAAIRNHRKKDGSVDWRAEAWLLQKSSPEEYGAPGRRPAPKTEESAAPEFVITPEQLVKLQARRAAALEAMKKSEPVGAAAPRNDAFVPENPTGSEAGV